MSLNMIRDRLWQRIVALALMCSIGLGALAPANADSAGAIATGPSSTPGAGITWQICTPPDACFTSKAAKDKYAAEHKCRFLEDVCEKTPPAEDNKGAQGDDSGIFGSVWNKVKGALIYGYEFVKGLVEGLKDQIVDLFDMVTNIDEVVMGLIDLGKAFVEDPKGTLVALAELLGQEAVDTITKATQCGAYDLGKVIGTYVSPAFAVKIASRLNKYSGKLADASKSLKHDYGCASFGAGTLVLTPDGLRAIETIAVGDPVYSRNELSFADKAQRVTDTFGRIAPQYRELRTEQDIHRVTDEHPLWVQGKGWTIAAKVAVDDVIAGEQGDLLVSANAAIPRPLRVYNFSVANTANYFVGPGGMWAHNATCWTDFEKKNWNLLEPKQRGFRAEHEIQKDMLAQGYELVGGELFTSNGKTWEEAFAGWDGQKGIDGVYYNKVTKEYVIVESKAFKEDSKSVPSKDCKGGLCVLKGGERQMSDTWIINHLKKDVPDEKMRKEILAGLADKTTNKVTKVYASTDAKGRIYHKIMDITVKDVSVTKVTWP